jgi:hypothetical protein
MHNVKVRHANRRHLAGTIEKRFKVSAKKTYARGNSVVGRRMPGEKISFFKHYKQWQDGIGTVFFHVK